MIWRFSRWQTFSANNSESRASALPPAPVNTQYPASAPGYIKLKVEQGGTVAGWAVVRATQMKNNKYFGNLYTGSLLDCLAQPGQESTVAAAAEHVLREKGCDLMLTNQSHQRWTKALRARGFFEGPSNCILARSRKLQKAMDAAGVSFEQVHFNRSDGDGPINL